MAERKNTDVEFRGDSSRTDKDTPPGGLQERDLLRYVRYCYVGPTESVTQLEAVAKETLVGLGKRTNKRKAKSCPDKKTVSHQIDLQSIYAWMRKVS